LVLVAFGVQVAMLLLGAVTAFWKSVLPFTVALAIIGQLMELAGFGFCLAVPPRYGARILAAAALALALVSLLVQGLSYFFAFLIFPLAWLSAVRMLVFLFFLRSAVVLTLKGASPIQGIGCLVILYSVNAILLLLLNVFIFTWVVSDLDRVVGPGVSGPPGDRSNFPGPGEVAEPGGFAAGFAIGLLGRVFCFTILVELASLVWYLGVLLQCHEEVAAHLGWLERKGARRE
jgi:hypothetical protein